LSQIFFIAIGGGEKGSASFLKERSKELLARAWEQFAADASQDQAGGGWIGERHAQGGRCVPGQNGPL
jgi:hypothetical protein